MKPKGMTLVELAMVLAIVSVVIGIIAPDFAGVLRRGRLEDFSHQLALVCRESYHSAVFSGNERWVVASPTSFITVRDKGPDGPQAAAFRPLEIPSWCDVDGLAEGWCANPDGFCDTGPITIRDREEGKFLTLRFRPYDGELTEEDYREAASE